jgi:hypothetical protein
MSRKPVSAVNRRFLCAACPLLLLALSASGCDPAYYVHMRAEFFLRPSPSGAIPAARAWIIPAERGREASCQAALTGALGDVSFSYGGFLIKPSDWSLYVYKPGYRLLKLEPGKDFHLKDRGWLFVTEWNTTVHGLLTELPEAAGPFDPSGLEMLERCLGEHHPELPQVLYEHAQLLRRAGREAESHKLEQRAGALIQ